MAVKVNNFTKVTLSSGHAYNSVAEAVAAVTSRIKRNESWLSRYKLSIDNLERESAILQADMQQLKQMSKS